MSCHLISLSFSRPRVAEVTSLQVFQLTFYCPWSHVNWMSMNFMCRIQDHRKYRHINIELNMNAEIQWSWRNRAICTSTVCFTVCFGPLTIQNEYLEALWRHHIHQHPGEESLKFNRYKKKIKLKLWNATWNLSKCNPFFFVSVQAQLQLLSDPFGPKTVCGPSEISHR